MRIRVFNLKAMKPPPMNEETRALLERYFAQENRGIADVIGSDVGEYWSYM
jgi:hypothetical protein